MKKFFPTINKFNNLTFFNNAAGSQVPYHIIDNMKTFLINGYTQPFDNNIISTYNYKNINNAKQINNILLNNTSNNGTIVFGNSCSNLMYTLSNSMENYLTLKNSNIIIADFNHESCITPFERIAKKNNLKLKWWSVSIYKNNINIDYKKLFKLIDEDTNLIVLPHVSNILGNVLDIKYLKSEIKKINSNAKLLVDGVAYMPHNLMDVKDTDVDFYVFSYYKLFGLRISSLYIKNDNFNLNIENQNHYFFENDNNYENKLQIGGINYECLSSINGIKDFFLDVGKIFNYTNQKFDRNFIKKCLNHMKNYEKSTTEIFQLFLNNSETINYYNDSNLTKTPLFSFTFNDYSSKYIVNTLNAFGLIISNGSFYSNRLISKLNIDETDGVIRVSFMHYNYISDVENLISVLKKFKKIRMDFKFCLEKSNIKLNDQIKNTFNYLSNDHFYKNERKRAFSLLDITDNNNIKILGDASFYQSMLYNSYNGNKLRYYENISDNLLNDVNFKNFISIFKNTASNVMNNNINHIYVHQIRVHVENNNLTNLIPEGIHKDGYNIVGMVCINRNNIVGGETFIYDNNKIPIFNKQLQEGEILIVNDNDYYHSVSDITSHNINLDYSYRDIFVFTTIS